MNTPKVVLITADSLNPATVNLAPGQLIAWISYSPTQATVVFERDVAKSMICHSRVNFTFEEGELRSAPIHAGEFASFCQLKPGTYRYKVERAQASDRSGVDADAMLAGEIVVGEK
jgi:plastocyanin